jgi:hypothetical protein
MRQGVCVRATASGVPLILAGISLIITDMKNSRRSGPIRGVQVIQVAANDRL